MVTLNGQIYKVDVKGGFIDIRQAFLLGDGKVVFQFRNYDKTKPSGQRITKIIDFYMDIDEFLYFCDLCKTGRIYHLLQMKAQEAQQAGKKYPSPGYMKLGGYEKNGKVTSRQFRIEGGITTPVFFKALQGPGRKTDTGLYAPAYKDNEAEISFIFKVSDEDIRKIGLMGEKAVDVFHIWSAQGKEYLEQRCNALSYGHQDEEKEKRKAAGRYNESRPVSTPNPQNRNPQQIQTPPPQMHNVYPMHPASAYANVEDRY